MLSYDELRKLHSLSVPERQKRYLELATKVANLIILEAKESQEILLLRDMLQNDAENRNQFSMSDSRTENDQFNES